MSGGCVGLAEGARRVQSGQWVCQNQVCRVVEQLLACWEGGLARCLAETGATVVPEESTIARARKEVVQWQGVGVWRKESAIFEWERSVTLPPALIF